MGSLPFQSFLVKVMQWRLRSLKGGVQSFRARPPGTWPRLPAVVRGQDGISSLRKWGNTVLIFQSQSEAQGNSLLVKA